MYKEFGIKEEVINLAEKVTKDIKPIFEKIDKEIKRTGLIKWQS